jgi:uncharacterized glyoxalase superfamily protein PhnB
MSAKAGAGQGVACPIAPMLSVRHGARAVEFHKSDAMFARAVAAGAREVHAVTEDYGWRLGRVVDPYGHHWEIGRPPTP